VQLTEEEKGVVSGYSRSPQVWVGDNIKSLIGGRLGSATEEFKVQSNREVEDAAGWVGSEQDP